MTNKTSQNFWETRFVEASTFICACMPTYELLGVPVTFPYEAYQCQIDYMTSVVQALKSVSGIAVSKLTLRAPMLC